MFTRSKRSLCEIAKTGRVVLCNQCDAANRAEARKQTMLSRYGTAGFVHTPESAAKRKATNQARYGGNAPLASSAIREKQRKTTQERYGVDNVSQAPEVRAKRQETMRERLGVPYAMMSEDVRMKSVATCTERYGVPYNTQSDVMKQKSMVTNIERYGVPHAAQSPIVQRKTAQTMIERHGVPYAMMLPETKRKAAETKLSNYGTLNPGVYGTAERELVDWAISLELDVKSQHVLPNGQTIDVFIPSVSIGIEYCGLYWHNEHSPEPRGRDYHIGKMRAAAAAGIRLITIFEDEWLQRRMQVENALRSIFSKSPDRLGARDCEIAVIDADRVQSFLDAHHILGPAPNVIHAVGLTRGDELIGAMTLGHHHRQNQTACVLNRLCFKSGVSVAGGASRMFARTDGWARAQAFDRIISWSDNRWFAGDVYPAMGFTLAAELPADYSYVVRRRPATRLSKQSQRKRVTDCPPGLTEYEWARERGLARIWDCGRKRWDFKL